MQVCWGGIKPTILWLGLTDEDCSSTLWWPCFSHTNDSLCGRSQTRHVVGILFGRRCAFLGILDSPGQSGQPDGPKNKLITSESFYLKHLPCGANRGVNESSMRCCDYNCKPGLSLWLTGQQPITHFKCFVCMYLRMYVNYDIHCTPDHPWKEGYPTLRSF